MSILFPKLSTSLHLTMYKGYLDMEEATMIDPKDVIDFPNNWSSKMY